MYQPDHVKYEMKCNGDGYIDTGRVLGPELNTYFRSFGKYGFGAHGDELRQNKIPPGM
jgi:hypothetical protein